jgi:two-component system, chemotaxis family, CheB/CheR fusion protein
VLINDQFDILHFVGRTDRYLALPPGKPAFNILNMARQELKPALTTTLHQAVREKTDGFCKNVRLKYNDGYGIVDLSVKQIGPGLMLVVFEDKTPEKTGKKNKPGALKSKPADADRQRLEQELQSTREYLQATIEELETSNEELKSANEELQSVNEELQSTNEEMETSKEELQSTNEELATVNAELQNRVDEFSRTNDDMNNLLASTEIASLFLDTAFCIKRYTPAMAKIISLISTDIGRPLNDLKTRFPDVDFIDLAGKVLKDLNTVEVEILSEDLIWHALKIVPYRATGNVINGVVMIFMDIHKVKQADKIRRLATVLEDANDAVMVLDLKGRILAWNKGARQLYGWTESEALQMSFADLSIKDRRQDFGEIVDKLAKGEAVKSFKTRRKTKAGSILDIWLTASALTDEYGRLAEVAITERDLAWLADE